MIEEMSWNNAAGAAGWAATGTCCGIGCGCIITWGATGASSGINLATDSQCFFLFLFCLWNEKEILISYLSH